jgi:hypothetical protein
VTDTDVLNDDLVDEVDVAHVDEDDDPEILTGEEVAFDLGDDTGDGA